MNKKVSDNGLDVVEDLLIGATVEFELIENVFYNKCVHFFNSVLYDFIFTLK